MRGEARAWGKFRTCAAPERRNRPTRPPSRGTPFPRGSCAFQARVLHARCPKRRFAAWGYFCAAFHAGTHVYGRRRRRSRTSPRTGTTLFQQGLRGFQGIFFSAGTRLGGEDIPVFVRKAEELPATLRKISGGTLFLTRRGRTSRP